VPVVTVDIARPPDVVWQALTDVAGFASWMPGLRAAEVLSTDPDGLAHEVHFDFSATLSYTLRYRYDRAAYEVHWEPSRGAREAVRGFARIEPHGAGSRLTYRLEQGAARRGGDLVLGGAHPIVTALVRWLEHSAAR